MIIPRQEDQGESEKRKEKIYEENFENEKHTTISNGVDIDLKEEAIVESR